MSNERPNHNQEQPESVLEKRERIKKLLLEAARLHAENPGKGNIFFGVVHTLGDGTEDKWQHEASVADVHEDVVLFAEGYEVPLDLIEEVELIDVWKM